jgi:nickel/cobalt transporter (NicO) family protein
MDNWTAIYSAIISLQRDISFALSGDIRQLAETGTLAPSLIALALALGAVHALTPGHGKSIILAYFVGHSARAIDGLIMAGKVAFSHSFTAIVLVVTLGAAVSKWGRPSAAAETLQMISYGLIAVIGLYYLSKAIKPDHQGKDQAPHALPYAVGVLPCPLTMLVVGNAIAAGSLIGGIGLAAAVAIGSTATISLFGGAGMLMRKVMAASLDNRGQNFAYALTGIEVTSSLAIFLIGAIFLVGSLRS